MDAGLEDLLRGLAPQVLGAVVRRYGHFDTAEDAVQEALLAASRQWPTEGLPDSPRAWLIRVAARRLTDLLRSEQARARREDAAAMRLPVDQHVAPAADWRDRGDTDDSLIVLYLCCHPALSQASQIALTLRAVGGLSSEEIARAFLVPEATMRKRISRAKNGIKSSGLPFRMPPEPELAARTASVLHVLYLIFNEGYTSTAGDTERTDLTAEAIRLARMMRRLLPDDGEVSGLLALMLLTDARRPARMTADGGLVPLAEQDRTRWQRDPITEGSAILVDAMTRAALGPYQLQAAIAAVHDEAADAADTDWPQILALYDLLVRMSDNPMVLLNRAVAVAMVQGPRAGLAELHALASDERVAGLHRLDSARAHLYEMAGDTDAARTHYLSAARRTISTPERRYLQARASRLEP